MPDVLSQDEVDALLASVDDSGSDFGDDLMSFSTGESNSGGGGNSGNPDAGFNENAPEIAIYDFKRPERVSTDQIRSMEMLHEVLARKLGASLSSYLRTIVDVKLASVEQLTYQEFIMSLPNPTCFNLLSCEPLDGQMVLEINPSIVYPILDKLLGGGNTEAHLPEREMSEIEWRLIGYMTNETLRFLQEAWQPILHIDFEVTAKEANPQLMQIVPPNEVVILVCFEVKMAESSGMLNICVPFPVVEPVMGNFSTIQTWFTTRRSTDAEADKKKLEEGVNKAKIEIITYLAQTHMNMHQFLNLKPGDVITTRKKVNDSLLMTIDGKPKYRGTSGIYNNYKAYKVQKKASIADTP